MAKNILVIDDEELVIRSLRKLLEINGFFVFVAKNGQEALEISGKENLDLIVADIRMPGINGVETVKFINEKLSDKNRKKTPTIFITGYADEEARQQAEVLEPIAYIYKPFDINELVGKIKNVLG